MPEQNEINDVLKPLGLEVDKIWEQSEKLFIRCVQVKEESPITEPKKAPTEVSAPIEEASTEESKDEGTANTEAEAEPESPQDTLIPDIMNIIDRMSIDLTVKIASALNPDFEQIMKTLGTIQTNMASESRVIDLEELAVKLAGDLTENLTNTINNKLAFIDVLRKRLEAKSTPP